MLYNKNQFSIANDKKKLVKAGKNWVVMSAFVLALLGGGYAFTQDIAHAQVQPQIAKTETQSKPLNNASSHDIIQAASQMHAKLLSNDLSNIKKNSENENTKNQHRILTSHTMRLSALSSVGSSEDNENNYGKIPKYDKYNNELIYLNKGSKIYPYVINGKKNDSIQLPGSKQVVKFGDKGQLLDSNNNPYNIPGSITINGVTNDNTNTKYYMFDDKQFTPEYVSYKVRPDVTFYDGRNPNKQLSSTSDKAIENKVGKPRSTTISGYVGEPYEIKPTGKLLSKYIDFDYIDVARPVYAIINSDQNNNTLDSWINGVHTFKLTSQPAQPITLNYVMNDNGVSDTITSKTYNNKYTFDKLSDNGLSGIKISGGLNNGDNLSDYYQVNSDTKYYYEKVPNTYSVNLSYKPVSQSVPVYIQETDYTGTPQGHPLIKAYINISGTYNGSQNINVGQIQQKLSNSVTSQLASSGYELFTNSNSDVSLITGADAGGKLGNNKYNWNTTSNRDIGWQSDIPVIKYFNKQSIPPVPHHSGPAPKPAPANKSINSGYVNQYSDNNIDYSNEVKNGVPMLVKVFRPTSLNNVGIMNAYQRFLNGDTNLADTAINNKDYVYDKLSSDASMNIGSKYPKYVPENTIVYKSLQTGFYGTDSGVAYMITKNGPQRLALNSSGSIMVKNTGDTFGGWDTRVNAPFFADGSEYNTVTGQHGYFNKINVKGLYGNKVAEDPKFQIYIGNVAGNQFIPSSNAKQYAEHPETTPNNVNFYVFYPKNTPILNTFTEGIALSYYKGHYYNTATGKEMIFEPYNGNSNNYVKPNTLSLVNIYDDTALMHIKFINSNNNKTLTEKDIRLPHGSDFIKYDKNKGKMYVWTSDKAINMNKNDKINYKLLTGPTHTFKQVLLNQPAGYEYDSDATNHYYNVTNGKTPDEILWNGGYTIGFIWWNNQPITRTAIIYVKPDTSYRKLNWNSHHAKVGPNNPGTFRAVQVDNHGNVLESDAISSTKTGPNDEQNPVYMPNYSALGGPDIANEKLALAKSYQDNLPTRFNYYFNNYGDGHNYLMDTTPTLSNNGMVATWYYHAKPTGYIKAHYINTNNREVHSADTIYGYGGHNENLNGALNTSEQSLYNYPGEVPDVVTINNNPTKYSLSDVSNDSSELRFLPQGTNIYIHFKPAKITTWLKPNIRIQNYNTNPNDSIQISNLKPSDQNKVQNNIELGGMDILHGNGDNHYYNFYTSIGNMPTTIHGKDGSIYNLVNKSNIFADYKSRDDNQDGTNTWITPIPEFTYKASQDTTKIDLHDVSHQNNDKYIDIPISDNKGTNHDFGYRLLPATYIPSGYQIASKGTTSDTNDPHLNEYTAKNGNISVLDIAPMEEWTPKVKVENGNGSPASASNYSDATIYNTLNGVPVTYVNNSWKDNEYSSDNNYKIGPVKLPTTIIGINGVVYYLQVNGQNATGNQYTTNPLVQSYNYGQQSWNNAPTYVYKAIKGQATVEFYDSKKNQQIPGFNPYTSDGNYGDSMKYNPSNEINKIRGKGYNLITTNYPTSYNYGNNSDNVYKIYFTHGTNQAEQYITAREIINYKYDNGTTAKPTYNKVINLYKRNATLDNVTHTTSYSDWQPVSQTGSNQFSINGVVSSDITNYTPSISNVASPSTANITSNGINGDKEYDFTTNVIYHQNGTIAVNYLYNDGRNNCQSDIQIPNNNGSYTIGSDLKTTGELYHNYNKYTVYKISDNGHDITHNGNTLPITHQNNAQNINIYLKHGTYNQLQKSSYTENITFKKDRGINDITLPNPVTQNKNVTVNNVVDKVTGQTLRHSTTGASDFSPVQIPSKNGYVWTESDGTNQLDAGNQESYTIGQAPTQSYNITVTYHKPKMIGHVYLEFYKRSNRIKIIPLQYTVSAKLTSDLDVLNGTQPPASNPNDYINKDINGFTASNFKVSNVTGNYNNNLQVNPSNDNYNASSYTETNPNDIVIKLEANTLSDSINNVYNGKSENTGAKSSISGYSGDSGNITSTNDNNLKSGWHLVNANTNYIINGNPVNVPVTPNTYHEIIHYKIATGHGYPNEGLNIGQYSDILNDNQTAEDAGNPSISISNLPLPIGYQLDYNQSSEFGYQQGVNSNGSTQHSDTVYIKPNGASDNIRFENRDDADRIVGNKNYQGWLGDSFNIQDGDLPIGYTFAPNAQIKFTYTNSHNMGVVQVVPASASEQVNYMYNDTLEGNNQFYGTYNQIGSLTNGATNIDNIPAGWQVSGNQSWTYNNGTANINIIPIPRTDNIKYVINGSGNPGTPVGSDNYTGNDYRTGVNGQFTIGSTPHGLDTEKYAVVNPNQSFNYDSNSYVVYVNDIDTVQFKHGSNIIKSETEQGPQGALFDVRNDVPSGYIANVSKAGVPTSTQFIHNDGTHIVNLGISRPNDSDNPIANTSDTILFNHGKYTVKSETKHGQLGATFNVKNDIPNGYIANVSDAGVPTGTQFTYDGQTHVVNLGISRPNENKNVTPNTTDIIQFKHGNDIVKSETKQGPMGTTFNVKDDIPSPYNVNSGTQFTYDGHTHVVNLGVNRPNGNQPIPVEQDLIDTIQFKHGNNIVKNESKQGPIGSSFDVKGDVPSQYNVNSGTQFTYDGQAHVVKVGDSRPNGNQTIPVEQDLVDTIQFNHGNDVVRTETKQGQQGTNFDVRNDVPSQYNAVGNTQFIYDGNTHVVNVINEVNKVTDHIIFNGDSAANTTQTGDYGTSGSVGAPKGYHYINGSIGQFTFNGGTHTYDVSQDVEPNNINVTDHVIYSDNNQNISNQTISGQQGSSAKSAIDSMTPNGYHIISGDNQNFADGATFHVQVTKNNPSNKGGNSQPNLPAGPSDNDNNNQPNQPIIPSDNSNNIQPDIPINPFINDNVPSTPSTPEQGSVTFNYINNRDLSLLDSRSVTGNDGSDYDTSDMENMHFDGYHYVGSTIPDHNVLFNNNNQTYDIFEEANQVKQAKQNLYWFRVIITCLAHTKLGSVGHMRDYDKVLKPSHVNTYHINKIIKRGNLVRFEFRAKFGKHYRNYYVTGNPRFTRNSYLQNYHLRNYPRFGKAGHHYFMVRVIRGCIMYSHKHYSRRAEIKNLHKGTILKVHSLANFGYDHQTRLHLLNGKWATANLNFIKLDRSLKPKGYHVTGNHFTHKVSGRSNK